MAKEQYITKTHKNKEGKEVTIKYRIDAGFVPTEISQISPEFMENYCVANNETAWLVETVQKKVIYNYKKGKKAGTTEEKPYPFVNQRADFASKFFPSIIKGGKKEDKETFQERILRLYGNKQAFSAL